MVVQLFRFLAEGRNPYFVELSALLAGLDLKDHPLTVFGFGEVDGLSIEDLTVILKEKLNPKVLPSLVLNECFGFEAIAQGHIGICIDQGDLQVRSSGRVTRDHGEYFLMDLGVAIALANRLYAIADQDHRSRPARRKLVKA